MLAHASVFATIASSVLAFQNQGILLPDWRLRNIGSHYVGGSQDTIPFNVPFDSAIKICAQRAVLANSVLFEIRQKRYLNADGTPEEDNDEPTAYTCSVRSFASLGAHEDISVQLTEPERLARCIFNCTQPAHFEDLRPNSELREFYADEREEDDRITLAERESYMSFEECKALAAEHNSLLQDEFGPDPEGYLEYPQGLPRLAGVYHYTTASLLGEPQKTVCQGISAWMGDSIVETKVYSGFLAPLGFSRHAPAANHYAVGKNRTNVACTQKDIPYEFYSNCQQFSYTYEGFTQPNKRQPATLEVVNRTQAIYYSDQNERFALTFNKIAQSPNQILPSNLQSRFWVNDVEVRAFTTEEALKICALQSVRDMRRSFNLYLTEKGWYCADVFEQLTDPEVLSEVDETVIQSYLFSAHLDSMRDPDGVDRIEEKEDEEEEKSSAESSNAKRPRIDRKRRMNTV